MRIVFQYLRPRLASMMTLLLVSTCWNSSSSAQSQDKLSEQLTLSESRLDDIVTGAEKHIRWFGGRTDKTDLVIVYLHGFSASRQELSPVIERVADQAKANVFFTRLTGHGRSDDAMAEGSVEAWKNDVREAYTYAQQLGSNIIVVGTSTGATLAAWAATQEFANNTKASILISPNFGIQNGSAWLLKWSWGLELVKWMNGDYHSFTPVSEQHGQFWTERYPIEALVPMLALVDEVAEIDKSSITIPQLMVYSPSDKVIDVDKALSTAKEFTSATVELAPFTVSTDHVQHVLAGVACSPEATEPMVELLSNYLNRLR